MHTHTHTHYFSICYSKIWYFSFQVNWLWLFWSYYSAGHLHELCTAVRSILLLLKTLAAPWPQTTTHILDSCTTWLWCTQNPSYGAPRIPAMVHPKSWLWFTQNPSYGAPRIPAMVHPESQLWCTQNPSYGAPRIPAMVHPESQLWCTQNPVKML